MDPLLVALSHSSVAPDTVVISVIRALVAARLAFGLWTLREWARRGVIIFAILRMLIVGYLLQSSELSRLTDTLHTLLPRIPMKGFQYSGELNFLLALLVVTYLMSPSAREAFDRADYASQGSY
jgi:uncharacterized membrane protein